MIQQIELVVGLLVAVAALGLLAEKARAPLPIILVIGGLLFALIPGLPKFQLQPDLVFLFFLPPLLYPAAVLTSWRDFHASLRPILLLAIGLVLFTTCAVGWLAPLLVPGLSIASAFVLGAIISPPDAVAATAITERLQVPPRIVTILDGESLVNDATALVAYRFGVAAVVTGVFSLAHASVDFFIIGLGGIALGLAIGSLTSHIMKHVDDPPIAITISLLAPFTAYLAAEELQVSGVLAVVAAGLYYGRRAPEIVSSRVRLQARPFWEMVVFLLNGFIFILIGLQLPEVMADVSGQPMGRLILYAVSISVLVIVMRIVWVFAASYIPRRLFKSIRERDPDPPWQQVAVVAWTGMRGVVSLAAALALPMTTAAGKPFPGRNLILFLTFAIILATLVLQGLSLPLIIRWLKITGDGKSDEEERTARVKANEAALARLKELADGSEVPAELIDRLRAEYDDRLRQLEVCEVESHEAGHEHRPHLTAYQRLQHQALMVERQTIIQLRNEQVINDEVMRRIERDLDLAEARLKQHHPHH